MLRPSVPRPVVIIMTEVERGVGGDGLFAAPTCGLACSDHCFPVLAELLVVGAVSALGGGLAGHEMTVAIAPQLVEPVAAIVALSRDTFMYRNTSEPPGESW